MIVMEDARVDNPLDRAFKELDERFRFSNARNLEAFEDGIRTLIWAQAEIDHLRAELEEREKEVDILTTRLDDYEEA